MQPKFSILVPHCSEDPSVCKFLFDSINAQIGVDLKNIEVIVCDDGLDCPRIDSIFAKKEFQVKHIKTEKAGVSEVRNILLDNATGEYLMYCDIDDGFFSSIGLKEVFDAIDTYNPDVLISLFIHEKNDGSLRYIINSTHVHGKIFNTSFFKESGVRWVKKFTHHEENVVIPVLISMTNKVFQLNKPFYIWKYNKDSVTRKEDPSRFCVKYFSEFIDVCKYRRDHYLVNDKYQRDFNTLVTTYYSYGFLSADKYRSGTDEFKQYYKDACNSVKSYLDEIELNTFSNILGSDNFKKAKDQQDQSLKVSFNVDSEDKRPISFIGWLNEIGASCCKNE